jgi:hypothetical protein
VQNDYERPPRRHGTAGDDEGLQERERQLIEFNTFDRHWVLQIPSEREKAAAKRREHENNLDASRRWKDPRNGKNTGGQGKPLGKQPM